MTEPIATIERDLKKARNRFQPNRLHRFYGNQKHLTCHGSAVSKETGHAELAVCAVGSVDAPVAGAREAGTVEVAAAVDVTGLSSPPEVTLAGVVGWARTPPVGTKLVAPVTG